MEFLGERLKDYIESHSSSETDLLKKINRDTHSQVLKPQMLSGHLQGRVLSMFSRMIKPDYILEIGTYTGYSAICMAEGLNKNGKLYTIDINEELEQRVRDYFKSAGLEDRIEFMIGDATKIVPDLQVNFDLVFIDADKINYSNYYDLVFDKVNNGGFIIADNVLWGGKVVPDKDDQIDRDTEAIMRFNEKVKKDPRTENVIFPVRDGLMVIHKV